MNIKSYIKTSGLLAFGLTALISCDDDKIFTPAHEAARIIDSIELDVTPVLKLAVDMDSTLNWTVLPAEAEDKTVKFESSDSSVATVDQNGRIHAVAVGECVISVTTPIGIGASSAVTLQVIPEIIKATGVEIVNTSESADGNFYVTDILNLKATILPADHTYDRLVWSSSDPAKASVDENGSVNCIAPGKVTITAATTDGSGARGTYSFEVKEYIAATSVSIKPLAEQLVINKGSRTLEVAYTPANATTGSVKWSSSNENVATVSRGTVTPTGFGTCVITATCVETGVESSTTVTVTPGLWIWDKSNTWNGWIAGGQNAPIDRSGNVMNVKFIKQSNGKYRADIKVNCSEKSPLVLHIGEYPVFALRISTPSTGNHILDCKARRAGSTDAFVSGGSPNCKTGIDLGDGTRLIYHDIKSWNKFADNDYIEFSLFQLKVADFTSVEKETYDVHWFRMFRSVAEAQAFAEAEVAAGK